ncbi:PREDICTED: very-long-chain (3R)-3-hydroxyacyl-[acyl-carrier protein] dehydratase 3 isoform X2 [Elephantulus edwardii]|uniref:very-long-chain (3R)-3-hydroxyacyl-[acyl-carrier protein] dehydratase 3 isoform X2 n=1 Tax=Elephantulus edwardii TaxID=28737 RepID=UPI0003F0B5F0|nr:PREDICTED: very-long-chain (3R)-3-hydroxyacyl-[acyl-carrier protein] dehydratase 3 isoform X2 [Elephantulus edwardii]
MENQVLTPHVYWAQRHRELYLRVELSDVQNPAISITENVLHFKAQGHGAKGDNVYEFHLEFLDPVKPEEEERLNKLRMEREGSPETFASMKKGYLFMYNLVQFLGFSWIFVNLTVRFFILGKESFYDTFHTVADMMYFCQMLAAVETINAAIGVTKSPVMPSLIQLLGRNFILFIIFGTLEEMQNTAVVFFVFYLWSTIEVFRYPFYMLACIDMDWKVLTWLRYSVWIPLYPLGCLAEAVSVIQSIPVFNETGRFSFTLPYPVKIKVRFSFFLQIYLIMLFLGLYINFRHLYKQRRRRYGHKKKKTH